MYLCMARVDAEKEARRWDRGSVSLGEKRGNLADRYRTCGLHLRSLDQITNPTNHGPRSALHGAHTYQCSTRQRHSEGRLAEHIRSRLLSLPEIGSLSSVTCDLPARSPLAAPGPDTNSECTVQRHRHKARSATPKGRTRGNVVHFPAAALED
jgi:hypothetical protein